MLLVDRLRHFTKALRSHVMRNTVILLYHRVADIATDPQLLCVTPDNFALQMEILRKTFNPISLRELSAAIREQKVLRRGVLVTFDDGYADNLYNAKPILERYEIPAIVFVATGYVGLKGEYWWDELELLLLRPGPLPDDLKFEVNGVDIEWKLDKSATFYSEESYREHADWNLSKRTVPTERHALYLKVYQLMRSLPLQQQHAVLERFRVWSDCKSVPRESHRPMTAPELRRLRDGKVIEVGAHTISHPVLSSLPIDAQREEIGGSRRLLEEIVGEPVTSFAYPYGGEADYTTDTINAVRDAGFEYGFSTSSGVIHKKSEPFRLPRNWVRNWTGDAFTDRLKQWFV
jgi:peptidoglycan/xylan/chitin deacetylase (PgdA/CDA1 family)